MGCVRTSLCVAAIGLFGVWVDAADLFVPVVTPSAANGTFPVGPTEQLVRIVRHELASVRDSVASGGAGRLLLHVVHLSNPLFDRREVFVFD